MAELMTYVLLYLCRRYTTEDVCIKRYIYPYYTFLVTLQSSSGPTDVCTESRRHHPLWRGCFSRRVSRDECYRMRQTGFMDLCIFV